MLPNDVERDFDALHCSSKPHETDLNCLPQGYEASDSFRHFSLISTVWTEAGFTTNSTTVKASYSCRIGLASNLEAAASTGWTEAGFQPSSSTVESVVLLQDRPSQ